MEIIVGKQSGFCNGVKYTIDQAIKELEENKEVYCLGQIVHNERVIEDLEKKGMITIQNIEEAPNNSKVIIRAHGEKKETYEKAKEKNIELIDLTCGKIKAIRIKIENKMKDSYIVIIGKKNHPETQGVESFSGNHSIIIESKEDINDLIKRYEESKCNKLFVISQTTFSSDLFDELVEEMKKRIKGNFEVEKTICNATNNRQLETSTLSKKVDIMIIVGGKNSSNTKELEIVAKKNCNRVYLIQDYHDLENEIINKDSKIGIMAGASTPDIVVEELIHYLHSLE